MSIKKKIPPDLLAIGALALLVILFFARVLFFGKIFLPLDLLPFQYPWRAEGPIKIGPVVNFEPSDAVYLEYPIAYYTWQSMHQGGFLWDPYMLGGAPNMARVNSFATNPLFLFYGLFMHPGHAIGWVAFTQILIAAISMYLWVRELGSGYFGALLAAIAFAFNGYIMAWIAVTTFGGSLVWIPLVFLGIERALRRRDWRWLLVTSAGFTLQIYSGTVMSAYSGGITLVFYALLRAWLAWRRQRGFWPVFQPLLYTGLGLGLGVLLAMPVLLPLLELTSLSQRGATGAIIRHVLSPAYLIRLLAPHFSGFTRTGDNYYGEYPLVEINFYIGVLPLLLAPLSLLIRRGGAKEDAEGAKEDTKDAKEDVKDAKDTKGAKEDMKDAKEGIEPAVAIFFFLTGLVMLLNLYGVQPFMLIVRGVFFVMNYTFAGRIFYVISFLWAAAAGMGADALMRQFSRGAAFRLALAGLMLAFGFAAFAVFIWFYRGSSPQAGEWLLRTFKGYSIVGLGVSVILLLLTAGVLLAYSGIHLGRVQFQGVSVFTFALLALVLVTGDMLWYAFQQNGVVRRAGLFPKTPSIRAVQELLADSPQPERVLNLPSYDQMIGMIPEVFGFNSPAGYESLLLKRYTDYTALTGYRRPFGPSHVMFWDCCTPLMDAMNIRYLYTKPGFAKYDLQLLNVLEYAVQPKSGEPIYESSWGIGGEAQRILRMLPDNQIIFKDIPITDPVSFRASISLYPLSWLGEGDGVTFSMYILPQDTVIGKPGEPFDLPAGLLPAYSRHIDPIHNPSERLWIPVEVDLRPYMGQTIHILLVTDKGNAGDDHSDWSGWGDPRLVDYYKDHFKLLYDEGDSRIYENLNAFPRAWIVHDIRTFPAGDTEAVSAALKAPDFDPGKIALVEALARPSGMGILSSLFDATNYARSDSDQEPGMLLDTFYAECDCAHLEIVPNGTSEVKIDSYEAMRVTLTARLDQVGWLVMSDNMYPGWSATVNGVKQPIYYTNLFMRGLYLPAGEHHIVFEFHAPLLALGLTLAAAALLAILLGLVFWRMKES